MLNDNELSNVLGGAAKNLSFSLIIGSVITVIVGIIDGYIRPLKCN